MMSVIRVVFVDTCPWLWYLNQSHNISQTTNRLSISQQSFFPSTTRLWNILDLKIRQLSTFESFKYKLKQHYFKNAKPPSYYNIGNIYLNILCILEYNSNNTAPSIGTIAKRNITTGLFGLTRIRNNCSALRNDLFHTNLIHNPSCSCGYSTENAEPFFIVLQEVWCTKKYFVQFFISCKCTHWLRDRPFNLKGVMVAEFFFRTTQWLEYFFLSREARFFSPIN